MRETDGRERQRERTGTYSTTALALLMKFDTKNARMNIRLYVPIWKQVSTFCKRGTCAQGSEASLSRGYTHEYSELKTNTGKHTNMTKYLDIPRKTSFKRK